MNNRIRQAASALDWVEPARTAQNAFHRDLTRYVNGAVFSRGDMPLASVAPALCFSRHGDRIDRAYRAWREPFVSPVSARQDMEIEVYQGENPQVHKMMDYLDQHLRSDVLGAYVHGSLGTYEENAYSDFDALVILKSDVVASPGKLAAVAGKLCRAKTIMYEFDPLQHHGWFVLVEDDLLFHCEAYFPVALFRHSKSLFIDKGRHISVALRDSRSEIAAMLDTVSGSIVRKIEQGRFPGNVYQLKCLTSEFMLLPALYVQRRTGVGEFKKYCFEIARQDFDPKVWHIMEETSELRQEWDYGLKRWQRRVALSGHVLRDRLIGMVAPAIPRHISVRLTPEFYARMHRLALLMRDSFLPAGS